MRAEEVLEVEGLAFLEPSFSALTEEPFTAIALGVSASESKMVVDEEEWPVALALRTDQGWRATSFLLRPASIEVVERFEEVGGEVVRVERDEWMEAVREYYSTKLAQEVPPAVEDLSPDRAAKVKGLLHEAWGDRQGAECLDCGCGSGMGSMVLQQLRIWPIAYDNDPALLSLGLSTGRLRPESTMWIDAALASHYARPCELGLALMAGSINDFTAYAWKAVLLELLRLSEDTLVTVETEKEAQLVKLWALGKGRKVGLFENDRDPFYDRWVCRIL